MVINKKLIKVEVDGKTLDLAVVRPNQKQKLEASKIYNMAWREALDNKAPLRAKIDTIMREQNLWDDQKEREVVSLQAKIGEKERKLKSGGIKASEGRALALELRELRLKVRNLTVQRISLDNNSAEAQGENAQFNYYVSVCTRYAEKGNEYFESYDEYLKRPDNDPVVAKAAAAMAEIIYGIDEDYEKKLPENAFLLKFKFADKDLNLIDKQGRKIDSDGRLIDSEGRYINENGEYVDINGNRIDKNGEYIVEESPFLDDDGNPIKV